MACQADEAGLSHLFGGAVHKQKVPAEPKRWHVRRMKQLRHLFGGAGHDQRNQRDDILGRHGRAASSLFGWGVASTGAAGPVQAHPDHLHVHDNRHLRGGAGRH